MNIFKAIGDLFRGIAGSKKPRYPFEGIRNRRITEKEWQAYEAQRWEEEGFGMEQADVFIEKAQRLPNRFNPKHSVVCCIEQEGSILLLHRTFEPFGWGLPGGKIEYQETPEQAIIREVEEETMIHLPDWDYKLSYVGENVSSNGNPISVFKAIIRVIPDVYISKEHDGYMWVSKNLLLPEEDFGHMAGDIRLAGWTQKFIRQIYVHDNPFRGINEN